MKLIKQCFKPLYQTTKYHIDDNMILYKMKVLLQCIVTKKTKRSTTHVRKRTSTEIKFSHYKAFLYLLLHILSGWLLYRNICFLMLDIKRLIKFINILPTKSYWKEKYVWLLHAYLFHSENSFVSLTPEGMVLKEKQYISYTFYPIHNPNTLEVLICNFSYNLSADLHI